MRVPTRESEVGTNEVLRLQNDGYRLRIPKNGGAPESVWLNFSSGFPPTIGARVLVRRTDVAAALASGRLTKLTEHGEGCRVGWRAWGLDGENFDWYVWTQ